MEKREPGCPNGAQIQLNLDTDKNTIDSAASVKMKNNRISQQPLQIDVILKHFFKFCWKPEDINIYRLVCRAWRDGSKAQWIRLTHLTVFQSQEVLESAAGCQNVMTLKQLREICEGTDDQLDTVVPFRKFKLRGWKFDVSLNDTLPYENGSVNDSPNPDLLDEHWFWNTVAPTLVTELTVTKCKFLEDLIVCKPDFLEVFPNLEKLTVWDSQLDETAAAEEYACRYSHGFYPIPTQPRIEPLPYQHHKLKSITIKAWNKVGEICTVWTPLLKHVPSLELLCVRGPDFDLGDDWEDYLGNLSMDLHNTPAGLKQFDVLDFAAQPLETGVMSSDCRRWSFSSLDIFKCDIGYDIESEKGEVAVLNHCMRNLRELYLYQPPLDFPANNILTQLDLISLRELHLWGVFAYSLEFLNGVPNLQVLVWTTSAYDEEYHGKRLFQKWAQIGSVNPFFSCDFVHRTKTLPLLTKMTRLEIDWEPKSSESWRRLGTSMPNLTNLKVVITNNKLLHDICHQWKHLESLELAHESLLEGPKLIVALYEFKNLRKFVWKGCLCTQQQVSEMGVEELQRSEHLLKSGLPTDIQFPWHYSEIRHDEAESMAGNNANGKEGLCIRGKYEKALSTGDPSVYTEN